MKDKLLAKHSSAYTKDDIGNLYCALKEIASRLPDEDRQLVEKGGDLILTLSIVRNRVREAVR